MVNSVHDMFVFVLVMLLYITFVLYVTCVKCSRKITHTHKVNNNLMSNNFHIPFSLGK